jgi:uncharacterized protein with PIN domain
MVYDERNGECGESLVKFVVDQMLGTLAKWLRVLGYDTVYSTKLDDPELVRIARAEDRMLLTRDTGIARRKGVNVLLIKSDYPEEQLVQVVEELGLDLKNQSFSRCVRCNQPLIEVEREAIREEVPPYVWQTQGHFRRCPECRRLYWRGTHWERMAERIAAIEQNRQKG